MPESDDPIERFSNRVGQYMRSRPDYPENAIALLKQRGYCGMGVDVGEMGAGTGILTRQLLDVGSTVWAIEPNDAMRSVADAQLGTQPQFHSVAGRAEETSLADDSLDAIVCGQSFHWFDRDAAKQEFKRLLRMPRKVAIIWNLRSRRTPFMEALGTFLEEYSIDFDKVLERVDRRREELDEFYGGGEGNAYTHQQLKHHQDLDFEGLESLVTSFSYMPEPASDDSREAMKKLHEIFQEHAEDGEVRVEYDTHLVWGKFRD